VLTLTPQDETPITLVSRQRAAFEILGDRLPPGFATVPLERGAARRPQAAASAED
jgi:hypothetical protein